MGREVPGRRAPFPPDGVVGPEDRPPRPSKATQKDRSPDAAASMAVARIQKHPPVPHFLGSLTLYA